MVRIKCMILLLLVITQYQCVRQTEKWTSTALIAKLHTKIKTRDFENPGPGKPVHFAKPETRVYDALKPGFRVFFAHF